MLSQFSFCDCIERTRHDYDRCCLVLCSELITEFKNLCRILLSTVNHDTISTGGNKCMSTCQCIFHSPLQDKTFNSGDNHEIVCKLRLLSSGYFRTKVLNAILCLLYLSSKQAVLLESGLVLNDDC